jgi:RNA polymerase sigma factor (sigma-70 family)
VSDVTRILSQIEQGDPAAAELLLPLVYDELRKLAAAKLALEKPGQTLQATALVHEAYLRLVVPAGPAGPESSEESQVKSRPAVGTYNSRGHFFGAAAEAMRRILVESARRKSRVRHGGQDNRVALGEIPLSPGPELETILAVDEAVSQLGQDDPLAAQVVKLHFFGGMTLEETADALGISRATTYRQWAYARARLRLFLHDAAAESLG